MTTSAEKIDEHIAFGKLMCFVVAGTLTIPLSWFSLMAYAFGGWNRQTLPLMLPVLSFIAFVLSFLSIRIGRLLLWGITIGSFFGLWISLVWWVVLLDAILLQIGDFKNRTAIDLNDPPSSNAFQN